jgi:cell division protein FtsI/penicillin-binding protein 2
LEDEGDLLAQPLGFTDVDNIGLEGIEIYLNKELQGRAGRRYTKRDALGREIKAFEIKTIPSVDGNRVTLTIDQYVQYLTERALDRAEAHWQNANVKRDGQACEAPAMTTLKLARKGDGGIGRRA